jgi:signal transduction histidine kinase
MHPPGAAAAIRDASAAAVLRDGSWRGETELRTRDGRNVPVSQVVLAHRTADGRLDHVASVMRDMSAERAAAAALEREREALQAVLESLAEGVVACDAEGRLTLFNAAARAFHGLAEDATLPPERWAEHYRLFCADGETPLRTEDVPLVRALRDGAVHGAEMVIAAEGQAPRVLSASGRRFADPAGRVLGAVVAMHDVTERAEAERRKSEFVTTVSHELRTPLTSIRGSLALLEAGVVGALPAKAAALVRIATANAERLIRLVTDVLDLDKIEAGKLEYAMRAQDPADVVAAAADGIAGMAAAGAVEVVTRIDTRAAVLGDRDRLLQVLTNLLSNAIKFSPPHSAVVLSAARHADAAGQPAVVRFAVEDYGPGIPPDKLPLLFQKFRQLGVTAATRRGGTGLGLAITRAIVEQHGGTVGVVSEPGRRTVFWCDLPEHASPA